MMIDQPSEASTIPAKRAKITILLADDHPLIRTALKQVLKKAPDLEIIGEADDGEKAVELALELTPDVVIMDILMPKLSGLEATRRIKASHPDIAVLVLTIHGSSDYIFGILEAGADGYLTKSVFGEEVVQAVRTVAAGDLIFSRTIKEQIIRNVRRLTVTPIKREGVDRLTIREQEILKLVAKGLSNKDVADSLEIAMPTVKHHLVEIFSKLRVGSRTEALIVGLQIGYLNIEDLTV